MMYNLPGVEIVGPAGGTTEPMIWVGLLMVEVVGLTISFLVAVEAVGTISLTAEVGRSPWGSMGQFIYHVSTFQDFMDPPPPLHLQ